MDSISSILSSTSQAFRVKRCCDDTKEMETDSICAAVKEPTEVREVARMAVEERTCMYKRKDFSHGVRKRNDVVC